MSHDDTSKARETESREGEGVKKKVKMALQGFDSFSGSLTIAMETCDDILKTITS